MSLQSLKASLVFSVGCVVGTGGRSFVFAVQLVLIRDYVLLEFIFQDIYFRSGNGIDAFTVNNLYTENY